MCVVVNDSVLRNYGAEHADMMVECFPRIETLELHRVIDKRYLRSKANIFIHVGTNNMRKTRNLDFAMGVVYAFVGTAKRKLPKY